MANWRCYYAPLCSLNSADLYAGAGVVADSDPKAELDETELKLTTVIDALEQTERDYSECSINE